MRFVDVLRWRVAVLGIGLLLLVSCGSRATSPVATEAPAKSTAPAGAVSTPAPAAARFTPALQEVLEKARKEGEVVWNVGSGKRTADDDTKASKAFEQAMGIPLKIKFHSYGQAVPQTVNKFITETGSGIKPEVDFFNVAGADHLTRMKKSKATMTVDWAALGIPKEDIEPEVDGIFLWDNLRSGFYNTKLVKADEAPRRWTDLLDPKWKGKIIASTNLSNWPFIAADIGEQKTLELARKLVAEQALALGPTVSDPPARVASSEYAIGFAGSIYQYKEQGAPIAYLPLTDKAGSIPTYGIIINNAPHPNAAKALSYYLSTREGQILMYEILGWSKRTIPATETHQVLGEGRGLPRASVSWIVNEKPRIEKLVAPIIGVR